MDEEARERQWRAVTAAEVAAAEQRLAERQQRHQSVELDCPPGPIRPGHLIDAVLEGTGLQAEPAVYKFMGCWRWEFEVPREEWVTRVVPVVKPRILALYEAGIIRYGSW